MDKNWNNFTWIKSKRGSSEWFTLNSRHMKIQSFRRARPSYKEVLFFLITIILYLELYENYIWLFIIYMKIIYDYLLYIWKLLWKLYEIKLNL